MVTLKSDGSAIRGKSYGILFDIETTPTSSPLTITGIDLLLDAEKATHYEVWNKMGSWQDGYNSQNANRDHFMDGFNQVSHGRITGKGSSDFTKVALGSFKDVEIGGGQRHAFWVTVSDNIMVFENYEGEGISRHEMANVLQIEKDELKVFYGAAVRAYPLEVADPETDFWYNAGFLGRVWYKNSEA